jgi:hypothetical protein
MDLALYLPNARSHSTVSKRTNFPILTYGKILRCVNLLIVRTLHLKCPAIFGLVFQSVDWQSDDKLVSANAWVVNDNNSSYGYISIGSIIPNR